MSFQLYGRFACILVVFVMATESGTTEVMAWEVFMNEEGGSKVGSGVRCCERRGRRVEKRERVWVCMCVGGCSRQFEETEEKR